MHEVPGAPKRTEAQREVPDSQGLRPLSGRGVVCWTGKDEEALEMGGREDNLNALNATDYVNRVKIAENDLNL